MAAEVREEPALLYDGGPKGVAGCQLAAATAQGANPPFRPEGRSFPFPGEDRSKQFSTKPTNSPKATTTFAVESAKI